MKLLRTGLVAAAVGASMALSGVLSGAVAQAAPPNQQTLKVTSFGATGNQGWLIDDDGRAGEAYPYSFAAGTNPPIGTGSLQFGTDSNSSAAEKMFVKRAANIPAKDFRRVSFDYRFATDSAVKNPALYYLNLYVDTAATGSNWYDCKYDYIASRAANGVWKTVAAAQSTAADLVTSKNTATCGPSIERLQPTDRIFLIAVNAGDISASDTGIKGALDNVLVRTAESNVVYDFDPPANTPSTPVAACSQTGLPTISGSSANEVRNGTGAAEKIDLLAGNDISDAGAGNDCVLGGDGNDRLAGAAGDDEIRAGAGNDVVSAGAGADTVDAGPGNDTVDVRDGQADTVDCGPGNDVVTADPADTATNCESRA